MLDALICVIVLLGVYLQTQKAHSPLLETDVTSYLHGNSPAPVVSGQSLNSLEQLEFVMDLHPVGDTLTVLRQTDAGLITSQKLVLVRQISSFGLVVSLIVSLVFVGLGMLVLFRRYGDYSAHIFHHLSVCVAVLISANPGYRFALPEWISLCTLSCFFISYALVPVFLLHFTFVFPKDKLNHIRRVLPYIYATALTFGAFLVADVLYSTKNSDYSLRVFESVFVACRVFFIILVAASVVRLARSYRQAESGEERRKLLWVLTGFTISVLGFAVLWLLPQLVWHRGLIAEEGVTALTIVAPVTFAIAIIRYRVMDIDFIVNRGTVYLIVFSFLLGLYGLFMMLTVRTVGQDFATLQVLIPIIIVINILLFAPARGLVQRFVDRTFFREQYNYRNTQRKLVQLIESCLSASHLAQTVVKELDTVLHPQRLAFVSLHDEGVLTVLASLDDADTSLSPDDLYDPNRFIATYSMLNEDGQPLGYLCCGTKKSSQRYTEEDIDLLVSIASQCGATMQRFTLQEKLLREHMESQRLAELNELKSYFVSGVTHELKTPLTSIKMFAEMLHSQVQSDRARKYLGIIEGESDRLTRLINNVLDYAKIERGVKEYHPEAVDVHALIEHVIDIMHYQIDMHSFTLQKDLQAVDSVVSIDADALTEALINLISNSLKYSADTKYLSLRTWSDADYVHICVVDKGVGISLEEQATIFEPFVRLKDSATARAGGAGLGLAIVKHFADAFSAKISVDSKPGEGTSICMSFRR